ncbi:hypothetical protein QOZ80_5AG0385420 [Eleusine coracana subsp. coracana]|nr:hypothetical protein QOZ80_5AG0385420 [Eleusine coracana subsp. coracana]
MQILLFIFLLLLSSQHPLLCSAATDTLSRGRVLTGEERLVSINGKFALGFFQTGKKEQPENNTLNTYLGIWFNKVPELTPVWTANRDKPISSQSLPKLMISGDGNLIISAQSTVIWYTVANVTTNDTVVVLLKSGNLVIRSSYNSSQVFWESFDYPTDTVLSGAKIGWNKITGLNRRLVSRKNSVDYAPGIYSSEMSPDGIGVLLWNLSMVYWSSGEWNGRFFNTEPEMAAGSSLCNFTYVKTDQEIYFIYTLLDENIIMLDVLDVSGQRKLRTWTGQGWVPVSTLPKNKCDVYATCGPFTICTNNGDTFCKCMNGFSVTSPEDWELEDKTGGCIRNTPLNCAGGDRNKIGNPDKLYSIPGIRLPQNGKYILNQSSAYECAKVCLSNNCSCTAYSYGIGGCYIWYDELLNVAADDNGDILYVRLAANEVQSGKTKWKRQKILVVAAIGVSVASLGLLVLILTLRKRKRKLSSHKVENDKSMIGIIPFKYADLQRATKNFSDKLGEGSFGSVFKGCLSDSVNIAVKRLDGARQGDKQFRAEVSSIGTIQHLNLVKLIGFCCSSDRRLLVYEYMQNHSLDTHLFKNGTYLDWTTRYQIALGVARGIAYLHHGCRDCIIHCDIKPQNILLDASFVPKIADFGLAKFLGRDFSRVLTTMRGTIGYLAPEWISGTAITSKVDVYSYGMVLLEIISGRRNCDKELSSDVDPTSYFPLQVAHTLLHGDVGSLLCAKLRGNVNLEEVERLCKVACWCIQDNEFD